MGTKKIKKPCYADDTIFIEETQRVLNQIKNTVT